MTLDPEFLPVYEVLPELDVFADIPASRAALGAASGDGASDGKVRVEDRGIVAGGQAVTVRIYTPVAPLDAADAADGPRPVAVWIHGGGFVLGGPNAEDPTCRRLCAELGITVVAPDYRLAPEHPYPAAFDDCYATLTWVADQADALGVDPARLAVGGHSAGAALAAGVALAARDREGPQIAFLYLGYPVLDDRQETESARTVTDPKLFNRRGAADGWKHYLQGTHFQGTHFQGTHLQDTDPAIGYAVPARAAHLRDLPPTYILADGVDPARDEALDFASRLSAAGNLTELHLVPGVPHMFDVIAPSIRASRRAVAAWTSALAHGVGVE
ncbi:alpha/beta hydrolase [Streptomyces sp. NPDC059477]|uniref:alpha/beta hydrolase n=1 Tax=Streptomyces sp. NPDC059477 TaxID=3346847 RepID=UPI0036C5486B